MVDNNKLRMLLAKTHVTLEPLVAELARRFSEREAHSPGHPFSRDQKPDELPVPQDIGLYCWFHEDEVVYVGKATGRGGLRQRIVNQHLNPKYMGKGRTTEKSQLRLKIAKMEPGYEVGTALKYIEEHLTFGYVTFEDRDASLVLCLEAELVRTFDFPKYNRR